jgi:hypothetical protein
MPLTRLRPDFEPQFEPHFGPKWGRGSLKRSSPRSRLGPSRQIPITDAAT